MGRLGVLWETSEHFRTPASETFSKSRAIGKIAEVKVSQMKFEWTKGEEARLRQLLIEKNARPDEIAKDLHRSVSAVKSKAHAMGMTIALLGNRRRPGLSRWG